MYLRYHLVAWHALAFTAIILGAGWIIHSCIDDIPAYESSPGEEMKTALAVWLCAGAGFLLQQAAAFGRTHSVSPTI